MKKIFLLISLIILPQGAVAGDCEAGLGIAFTPSQRAALCSSFGAAIRNNLIPSENNEFNLGSSSLAWERLYLGTALIGTASAFEIATNTVDGSDTKRVQITGGSSAQISNGAYIYLYGNESGTTTKGDWYLRSGDVAADGGNGHISARNNLYVQKNEGDYQDSWTFNLITGEFTGAGTGAIGWTIQTAANQACSTTCVTPCVFGQETTSKAILACSDATADSCLCAGAS